MTTFNHEALKKTRRLLRLKQCEVAERLKMTQSLLSKWESGVIPNPSSKKLSEIAELYGCDVGDFFIPSKRSKKPLVEKPKEVNKALQIDINIYHHIVASE